MHIQRLTRGEPDAARALFALLSEVLGEGEPVLHDAYIAHLLQQGSFWAIAAIDEGRVIGGLTAHLLPMTKAEHFEMFVYDVAVREDRQRQGIGQTLVSWAVREAFAFGARSVFVLADNLDVDAIRFYQKLDGVCSPVTLVAWAD